VALMCVQEKTIDRLIMADVVAILSSDGITLPEPKQPAYSRECRQVDYFTSDFQPTKQPLDQSSVENMGISPSINY